MSALVVIIESPIHYWQRAKEESWELKTAAWQEPQNQHSSSGHTTLTPDTEGVVLGSIMVRSRRCISFLKPNARPDHSWTTPSLSSHIGVIGTEVGFYALDVFENVREQVEYQLRAILAKGYEQRLKRKKEDYRSRQEVDS